MVGVIPLDLTVYNSRNVSLKHIVVLPIKPGVRNYFMVVVVLMYVVSVEPCLGFVGEKRAFLVSSYLKEQYESITQETSIHIIIGQMTICNY